MENVFKEIAEIKEEFEKDKASYDELSEIAIKLADEYLQSMLWCRNETERKMYMWQSSGLSAEEISNQLNMNASTYRCTLSRISARLRKEVFNTNNLYETLLSFDSQTKKDLIHRLMFLKFDWNLYKQVNPEIINILLTASDKLCDSDDNITEEDLVKALVVIKMNSNEYIQSQLRGLKAKALHTVIDGLNTNKYNVFFLNFMQLGVPYLIDTDKWIQKIKKDCKPMLQKGDVKNS